MPKFLFKADDRVLSFCRCEGEPAMSSGQLDCPWCGCGWLISCSKCKKAFTFGVVREIDTPLEELARREAASRNIADRLTDQDIADWVAWMTECFEEFADGDVVVYLDGHYLRADATDIEIEGYFAIHRLPVLPHAEALADPPLLDRVLGDKRYWLDRECPDRHDEDD